MKIFMTGASGFIGKRLQKILAGHNLLILTRSSPINDSTSITYVKGDLCHTNAWRDVVKKFGPDAIIHAAWDGIPDYSYATSKKNLQYGLDMLELCQYTGCKTILFTGSCWEYDAPHGKISTSSPLSYANSFKTAKNTLHKMAACFCHENDIKLYWLRLFYVYGPGQKPESLIPTIINSLRIGKPPKIVTPHTENDFVYVDDVANCIRFVLENKPDFSVVNIGSGQAVSILSVVEQVADKMKFHMDLDVYNAAQAHKASFYADMQALEALGYRNKFSLSAGIDEMLKIH